MKLLRSEIENKKVLVFGSGISGIGAVKLLEALEAQVVLYDGNEKLQEEQIRKQLGTGSVCSIVLGELPKELISTLDLVVMSPGVPLDIPAVEQLRTAGIPIWGEVELAYQMGAGKVLAITGTNGKTTTTALLGEIMKADQAARNTYDEVYVVGNIGNAYTKEALSMKDTSCTVAEISSFQLETADTFRPDVSGILNITEDHLNRHHTMEEYIRVKELIAANQTKENYCILNYEDPVLREFAAGCGATVVFFSSVQRLEQGIFLEDGKILLRSQALDLEIVYTKYLKLL